MAHPLRYLNGTVSAATCLELFRLGWDTVKIAAYHNITEAEALRAVSRERAAEKNLPNFTEPSPYAEGGWLHGRSIADWLAKGER